MILDRLRCYIFSAGCLEQVLLAVGDLQIAVGAQLPDVSRIEPAVNDRFRRLFLHLVIALHDVRPADQDFPILGNLDLHVLDDLPRGAETDAIPLGAGNDWRGLGQPVGFANRNSDSVEKLRQVLGQRCGAGDEVANPAAEPASQFRKNQPVGESVARPQTDRQRSPLQAVRGRLLAHLQRPVK